MTQQELSAICPKCKGSAFWCMCEPHPEDIEGNLAAAPQSQADNWQQYAKEGETAQQVIERHRGEQDALLKLLAKARETEAERMARYQREHMENIGAPQAEIHRVCSGIAAPLHSEDDQTHE